jgi:hypothetical protein
MANENSRKRRGFFTSLFTAPVALIRVSSILFVLLMIGHLSGYPWTSKHVLQEKQLVGSMKTVELVFFAERSSYWNLYFGWGLLVALMLLTIAIVLWLLSDIARLAPRPVGLITGVISANCPVHACLCFRFFYTPPVVMLVVMCIMLLTATVQLLTRT